MYYNISSFNKSVKNSIRIANKYGYRVEVITIYRAPNHLAFLSLSHPSFRSPYPDHFTSNIASYEYCINMFNKIED